MNKSANTADLPYRAEFLAVQLSKEKGTPLDKITIRSAGADTRGWKGDILDYTTQEDENGEDVYVIEVARDGLVQRLANNAQASAEEFNTLLAALDCEFNLARAGIEQLEQESFVETMRHLFEAPLHPVFRTEELRESIVSRLLLMQNATGNLLQTEHLFQEILGEDVSLHLAHTSKSLPLAEGGPALGDAMLDLDFTLAGEVRTRRPAINIEVKIPQERISEFLEGGQRYSVIQALCKYVIPIECDHVLLIDTANAEFLLSDDVWTGRLGFTANLSAGSNGLNS